MVKSQPTIDVIMDVFERQKDPLRALSMCEKLTPGVESEKAELQLLWAKILVWSNRPGAALDKIAAALSSGLRGSVRVRCLLLKGEILCELAKAKSARDALDEAKSAASKESKDKNECLLPEILMTLGQALSGIGDQGGALAALDEADRAAGRHKREDLAAGICARRSLCHFRRGDLEAARLAAEAGLGENREETVGMGECFRGLAIVHTITYRTFHSLRYHQKALDLFKKISYTPGVVREYISLGLSYLNMSDLELAEHFFSKAARLAEEGDNFPLAATAYSRLGTLSLAQGSYQDALGYYEKDRRLSSEIENPANIGYIHRNIGRCLSHLGRYEEAVAEFETAVKRFGETDDRVNRILSVLDLVQSTCLSVACLGKREQQGRKKIPLKLLKEVGEEFPGDRPSLAARKSFVEACVEASEGRWQESQALLRKAMDVMESHANYGQMVEMICVYARLAAGSRETEFIAGLLKEGLRITEIYSLHGMKVMVMRLLDAIGEERLVGYSVEKEAAKLPETLPGPLTEMTTTTATENVVGSSRPFIAALQKARKVAETESTVLLHGESGTGKEVMARLIHRWSRRASRKFIAVNCGAIPRELLESILFGHVKGAFTGAVSDQKGSIESAEGGTVFLDEITELPLPSQVKLLRFLESREIHRLGEAEGRKVDVRIIAATNREPWEAMKKGILREDLYYRISVVPILLPPLREREDDVVQLARHFIAMFPLAQEKGITSLTRAAEAWLKKYSWPGNVRELANFVTRAVIFGRGPKLTVEDLEESGQAQGDREEEFESLESFTRRYILEALRRARGNKTEAARLLGMHRNTLMKRLNEIGGENDA